MSWALRKSSKVCSALATARRCRVGRVPSGRVGSVLVIVTSVYGVPVAVVDVVDVVAVRHALVAAGPAVLVGVRLGGLGVLRPEGDRVALLGDRRRQPLPPPQPDADR